MKLFLKIFAAIVAGGIALYIIYTAYTANLLEEAREQEARERKAAQERQVEIEAASKRYAQDKAVRLCGYEVKDRYGIDLSPNAVIRKTERFVAFNIQVPDYDKKRHFRCFVSGNEVTKLEMIELD